MAFSAGALSADTVPGFRVYSVKEARIVYALSGTRTGTKSLEFSEYGSRTRMETHATTSVMGRTLQDDTVVYTDGEWVYTLDLTSSKATKQRNPLDKEATKRDETSRPLKSPEEYVRAIGGDKSGSDRVLGHACDIWDIKPFSTKACLSKEGIPLWTEVKLGGVAVKETATELSIGAIPMGATALPEGVIFVETENPLDRLCRMKDAGGDRPSRKRKGQPLSPEQRQEVERMRKMFESGDRDKMQEQIKWLQEQLKDRSLDGR
jgi:hypothetical protein